MTLSISRPPLPWPRIGIWFLPILTAGAVIAGHLYSRTIAGPFIFGDESTYFQLARNLAGGGGFSGHTQYGPLYPALISAFFGLPDDITTYKAVRLFNLLCFASTSVPVYLLTRQFTQRRILCLAAAGLAVLMPHGAFAYLIWAEPVYFPVLAWVFYLFFRYSRAPGVLNGALAGAAIGAAFLLKPAAIILAIAAILAEGAKIVFADGGQRRLLTGNALSLLIAIIAIIAPWIVRNLVFSDGGPLGYPLAAMEMQSRIAEIGVPAFAAEVGLSVFYQISYIILGTFGFVSALGVLLLSRWRQLQPALRWTVVFLFLTLAGLIVMSAVHMTAYRVLGYHVPNGRYYCGFFPLIFLFYFVVAFGQESISRREVIFSILSSAFSFVIIVTASPLLMVTPYSLVNNPEMAVFYTLFEGGHLVWRGLFLPSIWQRLALGAFIGGSIGFSLLAVRVRAARLPVLCLFAGLIGFTSSQSHRFVAKIGESQTPMNRVVSHAAARQENPRIFFDSVLAGGNAQFVMETWTGRQEAEYIDKVPTPLASFDTFATGGISNSHSDFAPERAYYITPKQLKTPAIYTSGWLNLYEIGKNP